MSESSLWAMKSAKQLIDLVDNVKSPLSKRTLALAVTFARRAVEAERREEVIDTPKPTGTD